MSIFNGNVPQKVWDCHFRDDMCFIFRQLDLEDGWKIEKKNGKWFAAYLLPYKLMKSFPGFKSIPACNLTLSYDRDIVLDAHHQMSKDELPEQGDTLKKDFMKKIAEARVRTLARNAKPTTPVDRIIIFLGCSILFLSLAIGFKVATHGGL